MPPTRLDVFTSYGVDVQRNLPIRTRDGVALTTDVYLPAVEGSYPALLLRTPYGRAGAGTEAYAHPAWYARQGFAVVCQDTRGRGSSDGVFEPFMYEGADGEDTIQWITQQGWSNGAVGMYGFSYPGAVQLQAAARAPRALKAVAPAVTAPDFFNQWIYRGGVLNLAFVLGWSLELGRDVALRSGDLEAADALGDCLRDLSTLCGVLPLTRAIDPSLTSYVHFLSDWITHRDPSDYWESRRPTATDGRTDIPGLYVSGWFDVFVEGALETYEMLTHSHGGRQELLVGPWYHMPWSRQVGERDFGPAALSPIDDTQVRFFRWALDADRVEPEWPTVRIFVMGQNAWRSLNEWPPRTHPMLLHLRSEGPANSLNGSGRLKQQQAVGDELPDLYVADPANPVPSLGGRSCCFPDIAPMGAFDQRTVEQRNDVLVYDGDPLQEDVEILGRPEVDLFVGSDCPTWDLMVRLLDVFPDGRAYVISDGVRRLHVSATEAGRVQRVSWTLSPTANRFLQGHRIRLDVASSNFPLYERNPQSGVPAHTATSADLRVATHALFHDARYPSRLVLPRAA